METLLEENIALKKTNDNMLSQMNLRMCDSSKDIFFVLICVSICFTQSFGVTQT